MLDDGKGMGKFPVMIKNGEIEINCKVYSKYAYLNHSFTNYKESKSIFHYKRNSVNNLLCE